MKRLLVSCLLLAVSSAVFASSSVYTTRLDDPKAVYLDAPEFGARGDGMADDSAAIQAAIPSTRRRLSHQSQNIGAICPPG